MVLVSSSSTTLSLEEFLQRPETKPASEYIDGRIYQKPMPQGKHSRLQTHFPAEINQRTESERLGCAFTKLRCTFSGRSIVPNTSVFTWERIPRNASGEVENTFTIRPDWVIEILSPEQRPTRVLNNILFCLNHGASTPRRKSIAYFVDGVRSTPSTK